jgi:antitoxin component of MazEF toxin-antitoxin module
MVRQTIKPFSYKRKLFRIGNSLAVTIPFLFTKAHGLREGDEVVVDLYPEKVEIKKLEN